MIGTENTQFLGPQSVVVSITRLRYCVTRFYFKLNKMIIKVQYYKEFYIRWDTRLLYRTTDLPLKMYYLYKLNTVPKRSLSITTNKDTRFFTAWL